MIGKASAEGGFAGSIRGKRWKVQVRNTER